MRYGFWRHRPAPSREWPPALAQRYSMNYVIHDPQQAAFLARATECVEILAPDGTVLGSFYPHRRAEAAAAPDLYPFTEADIVEAKRRLASNSPRYTTQQVLDHLRSLEGK